MPPSVFQLSKFVSGTCNALHVYCEFIRIGEGDAADEYGHGDDNVGDEMVVVAAAAEAEEEDGFSIVMWRGPVGICTGVVSVDKLAGVGGVRCIPEATAVAMGSHRFRGVNGAGKRAKTGWERGLGRDGGFRLLNARVIC
ncbi:hypothetical protein GWI33_019197 [Rhynchophorus ferrugineus]|uniref:Uncharacterized protein n=1 Tax=Rhynchophorus ferrugineus TaxID=354439 RepID=A0A834M795_RHYFE|nr:hypothetical protein GWI33_019197 [Rhynchophorus ferrugineus]